MSTQKPAKAAHGERNIEVFAEATTIEGWRKQAIAGQRDTRTFAIIADEGEYMPGGEGTAPTPLTYFIAGIALCLLSQVSNIAMRKKLKISNEKVNVVANFLETGSILKGDKWGEAQNFRIEMKMESEESEEKIAALMKLAHEMCFVEDALHKKMEITYSHSLNGKSLDI
jgi:uncharacterized OsmC-like protein